MRKKLTFVMVLLFGIMVTATGAGKKTFTLVIDAGHGGHDAGAVGAMSKEKNINLNVALAFGRLVEANCPDVNVVYTRKTDVFIPLNERANIANRNKADLFISVHTNALPKGRVARGFEVYTLGMHRAADNLAVAKRENSVISLEKNYKQRYQGFDPNSSESYIMFEFIQDRNMSKSVELAKMIQKEACASAGRNNMGVHQAGFLVLRATSMPSCLIELGFITTPDEERYLNSKDGIDRLARGIYNAFRKYKNKYHAGISAPEIEESEPTVHYDVAQRTPTRQAYDDVRQQDAVSMQPEQPYSQPNSNDPMPVTVAPKVAEVPAESFREPTEQPQDMAAQQATETQRVSEMAPAKPFPDESEKGLPVFKVQVMAMSWPLPPGSSQFQGMTGFDSYVEDKLVKYTYGSSTDLNKINRIRQHLLDKFPQAFVIAFKDGVKMDVREAIREFNANNNKNQL